METDSNTFAPISSHSLRRRIEETGSSKLVVKALQLALDPNTLIEKASEQTLIQAFGRGSLDCPELKALLHRHPFPEIGTQNIPNRNHLLYHLEGGYWSAKDIASKAVRNGFAFEKKVKVLDFGCGASRILRYLTEFAPGPRYFGSEVCEENIRWGRTAFPEVSYYLHQATPPMEFPSGHFDLIVAYSIFTHYSENMNKLWLAELRRVLSDRGIIIATTHGVTLINRCLSEPGFMKKINLEGQDPLSMLKGVSRKGHLFISPYDPNSLSSRGIDPENWGFAFLSEEYIYREWGKHFSIIEYAPGGISRFQDWVILRPLQP